jgi:thermolabile hemolysin
MNPIRQTARRTAALALLAMTCASPAARSQEFPGTFLPPYDMRNQPDEPDLRCWLHDPGANPLSVRAVVARGYKLKGHWANVGLSLSANLFYTREGPDGMRQACERAAAAEGLPAEALVDWTAAHSSLSYNHAIWHERDLAPHRVVERVVSFGDSLSDKGNSLNDFNWEFPQRWGWFHGRFSNGRVWTEHLAGTAGLTLYNWAIGGAETDRARLVINSLDEQVASFAAYTRTAFGYDMSRTLFTVLIGANDFMNDDRTDINSVTDVMMRQKKALVRLGKLGAKRILLLNLPDISTTPSYRMRSDMDRLLIHDKVRLYNEWLPDLARQIIAETGADIRVVDMGGAFRELLDEPARFGIGNTTQSCLNLPEDSPINYFRKQSRRVECRPDEYVFWDHVHPTTRVHRLIAERAFAVADEAWGIGKATPQDR